jgi:ABC-2 type transport system ATP-binding protein
MDRPQTDGVTILARGLTKTFQTAGGGRLAAVNGIDLKVCRGETYGLIGPDGGGKTTTLRVLLGLLKRTAGESRLLGFDPMRDPYAIRERVGYIPQQFALPSDLTVTENMLFFASVQGVSGPDRRRRIPALLEFAGLTRFSDRLAGKLSGGMKKKLALACSLIHEPQVLLLDEPTLGVDPVSRREFWHLLADLRTKQGLTVLVCTPYMDEAERCDRIGLIFQGELMADDVPAAIKKQVPGRLIELIPSDLRRAVTPASGVDGVLEVQTYGPMLHIFVDDPARTAQIEVALRGEGITCQGVREIEPRMEDVFISLVRRRGAAQ